MSGNRAVIRIERDPLSEQRREQARLELRETPETVQDAIKTLRKLLQEDKSLRYDDDDFNLIRFLRPTKFYPESALALMRRAGEFKIKNANLLKDIIPLDEKDAFMNHSVVNVLADRDQFGRRILIVSVGGTWDTRAVTADQLFKLFYLVHIGAMLEPETQVAGVVVVMDFNGLTMRQVGAFSPSFSMRLLSFIQDAMPLRLKEVHIVKQPFIFNMVFTMFKPFIREKLRGRMFFHGNKMDSLHKHIDPDYLPSDYGGRKPKIDYSSKDWYPILEGLNDEVRTWNSYGLVEGST